MQGTSIIEMRRHYPFDKQLSSVPNFVKLRRKFQQYEYQELRDKIQLHSRLNHSSLIKICKGFQSKKHKYFDIFLEYIPCSLRGSLKGITLAELFQIKQTLLNLCVFLLQKGIHPLVTEEVLGFSQGKLRYYLDVDYSSSMGSLEELIKAKDLEISSIFSIYEQLLQGGSNTLLSQYLLFRNKSQSTIRNVPKYSANINSPRFTHSSNHHEPQETVRIKTQQSIVRNMSPSHKEQIKLFSHSTSFQEMIFTADSNPYVSSRQSLLAYGKIDNQAECSSNQIVTRSKQAVDQSGQVKRMFQEVVIIPKGHPYEQVINMKSCQSEIGGAQNQGAPEATQNSNPPEQKANQRNQQRRAVERDALYKMGASLIMKQKQQKQQRLAKKEERKQKEALYLQAFGHKNDPLTKEFNTLFDNENSKVTESKGEEVEQSGVKQGTSQCSFTKETKEAKEVKMSELKKVWVKKQKPDLKQINIRVKKALQKSEETLESFRRHEKPKQ